VSNVTRVTLFLSIGALLVVALLWSQSRNDALVVSGFIEADQIRLGSRVGGRVGVVHVEEGDHIDAGATLLELEPFDLSEQRAGRAAELAGARAELSRLEAGLRSEEIIQTRAHRDRLAALLAGSVSGPRVQELATAGREVELAQAELELARLEEVRARTLHESGVESAELRDRAVTAMRVAEATLAVRQEQLALLKEGTRQEEIDAARAELAQADAALALAERGYRVEEIEKARAAVAAAESALAMVDRSLEELAIRSPIAGIVEAIELQPGDLVVANAPALSLLDPSRLWVRAYVPENRLALATGQEVSLGVDSFPDETFRGRVSFIAREAEFTPGNVQTPEERSKQVFRIKIDLIEGLDRLRPGMSADVIIQDSEEDDDADGASR
jgi:multidrug resistance efflux pump